MRIVAALVLVVMCAGGAYAEPANLTAATSGYLYFNRPGASLADHDSELRNCVELASNNYIAPAAAAPGPSPMARGVLEEWLSAQVNGSMLRGWERAHRNIVVEHCMVVRGWRLVEVDAANGRTLAALDRDALRVRFSELVGAPTPSGQIVRTWRNEAADPGSIIASSPRNARRTLLSALAMDPQTPEAQDALPHRSREQFTMTGVDPVNVESLPTLGEGQAMIIVGLRGSRSAARRFSLNLLHEDGDARFYAQSQFRSPRTVEGGLEKTLIFIVHAGEWRVQGFMINMEFCLGAPAFELAAGDIVFAGEFDADAVLHPDLSAEAAQRHVPAALAERAHPANWMNGATWACPPYNLYALEFEGSPFRPDYHWGSAAYH